MIVLPPLPVDDVALDLYWSAIYPGETSERSSVGEVLDMYAELAGSDLEAIDEVLHRTWDGEPDEVVMRDPAYHVNDLISALIEEIRRLRGTT